MGEMRNAYKLYVGKPKWKRPLTTPRCREEDNFKMDVRDIGWKCMDWFHVAQGRDQWPYLTNVNLQISQNARNFYNI
jgi:hypothetical protein